MAYRNKVYVCFDGDSDIHYYRLMQAWHQSDSTKFSFYDAHDINTARDTSAEESIKRQLRERLLNAKVMIVLVGQNTRYLYKFVKWELEQAIALNIPIIAVNLNNLRQMDPNRCPPTIRDQLVLHISFRAAILQKALENWPQSYLDLKKLGKTGPYYYESSVYSSLGILS